MTVVARPGKGAEGQNTDMPQPVVAPAAATGSGQADKSKVSGKSGLSPSAKGVFGGIGALFFVIIIAGIWWSRYKKKNGIGVSAHPRGLKPQR
jgi:hypothetical protein